MAKQGIITREVWRKHDNAVHAARYHFEQALKFKKYAKDLDARLEAYMAAQADRFEATRGEYVSSFKGTYADACEFFGGAAHTSPRFSGVYATEWFAT